jgi:hypothetical protein
MKHFKYYLRQVIFSLAEASSGLKRASMEVKDEDKFDALVNEIDLIRIRIVKELTDSNNCKLPDECV